MTIPETTSGGPTLRVWASVGIPLELLARFCSKAAGVGMVVLMLVTLVDVSLRKFTDRGLAAALDLTELGLVVVTYLAVSQAEIDASHIRTSLVTSRLRARTRAVVGCVAWVLTTAFLSAMTWNAFRATVDSHERGEVRITYEAMKVWPVKGVIAAGLLLLTLSALSRAVSMLMGARGAPADQGATGLTAHAP